jgi:hypothetical protein
MMRRRLLIAVATIALAGIAAHYAQGAMIQALAYLLPALLLLVVLATRSYPGERALLAFIERRRRLRHGSAEGLIGQQPILRALIPRGGRLIAASLAERPPPTLAAVSLI